LCFDDAGNPTKYLNDFTQSEINFKPRHLGRILSQGADNLDKFHDFCFDDTGNPTKYLSDFIKAEFKPKFLSKVLHGADGNMADICSALKDFHAVCFNEDGSKTECLNNFTRAGFTLYNLSRILSLSGANAASNLSNFHKLCFYKRKKYLSHFLAEKELFTLDQLSNQLLCGAGLKICSVYKKLYKLCFDKTGTRTEYLNSITEGYANDNIISLLYEKIRKD